ncbi:MAG: DNA-binding MarR family transcriptional regulator [Candidatus Azotimanducaceae bacterium]
MKDYDDILISLRQITRAIDIHSRNLQKRTGLTTSQVLVLEAIGRIETPTPGSVAKEIVLSQATVTNLLDRLEKRGLVRREKMDADKRSVWLAVTAEGLEKIETSPEILQSEFLAKYRKLETWERQMLVASLSRIASMMNAEGIDASPILTSGEIGKS